MNCLNCNAPNPPGVASCVACRIPGDFGHAPTQEATVIAPKLIECSNCAGPAPTAAIHCPSCRWPLPKVVEQTESASAPAMRGSMDKTALPLGIQYKRAG